jgi:hypothetical protein
MTNIVALAVALALQIEGGKADTVGDGGRAVGPGQMWPVAIHEVNRIIGTNRYTLADRRDLAKVREMMTVTLQFHHARHPERGVVWLASKWRNPYTDAPEWHMDKLRQAATQGAKSALDIRCQ